jgi:hypothetical protein
VNAKFDRQVAKASSNVSHSVHLVCLCVINLGGPALPRANARSSSAVGPAEAGRTTTSPGARSREARLSCLSCR